MMSKKTLVLNTIMVFCTTQYLVFAARQFYIWAAIREQGVYSQTIASITVYCLLGFILAISLVISHVKSVTNDICKAETKGRSDAWNLIREVHLDKKEHEDPVKKKHRRRPR